MDYNSNWYQGAQNDIRNNSDWLTKKEENTQSALQSLLLNRTIQDTQWEANKDKQNDDEDIQRKLAVSKGLAYYAMDDLNRTQKLRQRESQLNDENNQEEVERTKLQNVYDLDLKRKYLENMSELRSIKAAAAKYEETQIDRLKHRQQALEKSQQFAQAALSRSVDSITNMSFVSAVQTGTRFVRDWFSTVLELRNNRTMVIESRGAIMESIARNVDVIMQSRMEKTSFVRKSQTINVFRPVDRSIVLFSIEGVIYTDIDVFIALNEFCKSHVLYQVFYYIRTDSATHLCIGDPVTTLPWQPTIFVIFQLMYILTCLHRIGVVPTTDMISPECITLNPVTATDSRIYVLDNDVVVNLPKNVPVVRWFVFRFKSVPKTMEISDAYKELFSSMMPHDVPPMTITDFVLRHRLPTVSKNTLRSIQNTNIISYLIPVR